MINNKENYAPALVGSYNLPRKADKRSPLKKCCGTERSGGHFDRLLTECTNEIREGLDESIAIKTALTEARQLVAQWRTAEQDYALADKLTRNFEDEVKAQMAEDESMGEMEAMRIAIEERRCALYEENYRLQQEEKDAEYVQLMLSEEAEEKESFQRLCEKDSEYAEKIQKELQDEILAEELYKSEEKHADDRRSELKELEDEDFKIAKYEQEKYDDEHDDKNSELEEKGYEVATIIQKNEDKAYDEKQEEIKKIDATKALKLMKQISREDHRLKKRKELGKNLPPSTFSNLEAIGKLWLEADAEVEDVDGGICLSILLPHLLGVKVKVLKRDTVEVEAKRFVVRADKHANAENSIFLAEFVIKGVKKLVEDNLSFDYSSESGLLHVYVENIQLGSETDGSNKSKKNVLNKLIKSFRRVLK
eukprot:gene7816-15983_t